MTDAELLDLGDILWAADSERFLPSDMSLNIENEGRSVGISIGVLLIDGNYRSFQLSLVSIKCFSDRNKSELFARANVVAFCRFP